MFSLTVVKDEISCSWVGNFADPEWLALGASVCGGCGLEEVDRLWLSTRGDRSLALDTLGTSKRGLSDKAPLDHRAATRALRV